MAISDTSAPADGDSFEPKRDRPSSRRLPRSLSPSSISTYETCPKKFEFAKIDHLPDPPGRAMLLGTFAHGVLEDLLKLDPELRTPESAQRIARDYWDRKFSRNVDFVNLGLGDEEQRAFRWEGWSSVEGYFAMENPATVEVVDLERKVQTKLGEVPVLGFVDRIEVCGDETVVSDYKTGKVPAASYKAGALAQPHFYAAMLAEEGVRVDRVRLLYISSSTEVSGSVTDVEIESACQRAADTWGAIHDDFSRDRFEATPSKLCDWCAYKPFCPAFTPGSS